MISQFLPLVEHQILRKFVPKSDGRPFSDIVVLMDMPGYNQGISYNLGYSQGVKNAGHDWNSSNQDIPAFTYDCPSGHSKDFCNGYTDGYGDEANDILG